MIQKAITKLMFYPKWVAFTVFSTPKWNAVYGCVRWSHSSQKMRSIYCQNRTKKVEEFFNRKLINQRNVLLRYVHQTQSRDFKSKTTLMYVTAIAVMVTGLSYAAVPMYRIFCQSTGYGGEVNRGHDSSTVEHMKKINNRQIRIQFNADTASSMQWKFKPQQSEIVVIPGETALAFYTATNPTDKPVVGISTYNVVPFEAGQYFNKIQCFCFEEQRLNPHEQVDMPVFFYIDPEFVDDPKMEKVDFIMLSYTFFQAQEGMNLPVPVYHR